MLPLSSSSSKSFNAYPRSLDFDIELGTSSSITYKRQPRKLKSLSLSIFYSIRMMIRSFGNRMQYFTKLHPILALLICLSFGITVLVLLSRSVMSSGGGGGGNSGYYTRRAESYRYPFGELRNLVMVAGHSVYVSSSCGKVDSENSWFLESYQRNPGQAATFVTHIKEGVQVAARDSDALLLFSGGETRKDAGPRSEAQSYWAVAEGLGWFGEKERVKWRALTEEHARDSFENLLFSVCRFRELTGTYPQNITVVGYDFKEERFAHLHRSAIGFPKSRFFYSGTPATSTSKAVALKGEALVRTQFQEDPYGCRGQLFRKKLGRDPFHRSIPYPSGCPEIEGLFKYCGITPYPGYLPWA